MNSASAESAAALAASAKVAVHAIKSSIMISLWIAKGSMESEWGFLCLDPTSFSQVRLSLGSLLIARTSGPIYMYLISAFWLESMWKHRGHLLHEGGYLSWPSNLVK